MVVPPLYKLSHIFCSRNQELDAREIHCLRFLFVSGGLFCVIRGSISY